MVAAPATVWVADDADLPVTQAAPARLGDADPDEADGLRQVLRDGRALGPGTGRWEGPSAWDLPMRGHGRTMGAAWVRLAPGPHPQPSQRDHLQPLCDRMGTEHVDDTQYLRLYLGQLRAKLERDPADPRLLLTEPGVGYRLADPGLTGPAEARYATRVARRDRISMATQLPQSARRTGPQASWRRRIGLPEFDRFLRKSLICRCSARLFWHYRAFLTGTGRSTASNSSRCWSLSVVSPAALWRWLRVT